MSICKITLFRNDKFEKYTCHEVRNLEEKWKSDFRKENGTDKLLEIGMKDRMYEEYCRGIDDFLEQCKCLENKCDKCSDEDYEGVYCRCESRNISLAKKMRQEGISSWIEAEG